MRHTSQCCFLTTILTVSHLISSVATAAEPNVPPRQPQIVAHRGLLLHAPEDTLANFRACLELRLGFEFDVQRTKDGVLVCIHDDTVDRTTNGTGRVEKLSLEEIRRLDAGSWFSPEFTGETVPTVEEIFTLIAAHPQTDVLIAVDIKAAGVEQQLVQLAQQSQVLDRLMFIGRTISEAPVRQSLRLADSGSHTAAVANNRSEFPAALQANDADWVYLRYLPTTDEVDAIHAAEKRAFVAGTPVVGGNLPGNWQLAAAVGVDAILTDHPLKLRATLGERRQRQDP